MSIHFTIPRAGLLAGCGGDSSSSGAAEPSQSARVQDTRTFTASETRRDSINTRFSKPD